MEQRHNQSQEQLDEVLERYYRFYKRDLGPTLGRMSECLKHLGNPHLDIAPAIHIAGTNGKGSTLAFIRAILEGQDYKINMMTSPHLMRFNERVYLNGALIDDHSLLNILNEHIAYFESVEATFFEAITSLIFKIFADASCDFSLIETGLGGRYDATNLIEKPQITLISTISRDHENFLGRDITRIAWEKAGIMKPNVPCIIGPQIFPEVYEVFREEAQKKNAPLYCAGHDWFIERDQNGQNILFLNKAAGWPITEQSYLLPPQLPLIGQHQFGNAALALIASKIILQQKQQCDIGIDQIAPHLQQVQWPARLQDLSSHSYASLLPKGYKLWLDGGHNDSAGLALKAELSAWKKKNKAPIHLVSGMIETKQADEFFAPLREIVDSISCVPITGHIKSYAAEKLVRIATQDNKLEGQAYANIEQALKALASRAHSRHNGDSDSAGLVLICGSLYLAGAALGANENAKNHPG